jgi:hypothetical protein
VAPLASVDEWPSYTSVPVPDNAASLLAASSGAIRDYCGWSISAETDVVGVFDGPGTELLVLPTLLLTAVTEVLVDGQALTSEQWRMSRSGLVRRVGGCWPCEFGSVQVTYSHGHNPAPDAVKALCVTVAARQPAHPSPLQSETVGEYSYRTALTLPGSIVLERIEQRLLDRYALR